MNLHVFFPSMMPSILSFSDVKIKGNDGEELSAHRNVLVGRSGLFSTLLNEENETTKDLIFPEFSSDTLLVILEYIYTGKVKEENLTIETVAKTFHCANFFLIEQLKLQIVEFFKDYLKNNIKYKANVC